MRPIKLIDTFDILMHNVLRFQLLRHWEIEICLEPRKNSDDMNG